MSQVTTAHPGEGADVKAQYERYVAWCTRSGQQALNPDDWMDQLAHLTGVRMEVEARTEEVRPIEPQPAPAKRARKKAEKADAAEEIKVRFTRIMVGGLVRSNGLSNYQRYIHRQRLGDERPLNVTQVAPCVVCGDMLCDWAGVNEKEAS
jgi:hypothetical protein